jgi:hypothetical protein
MAFLHTQQDIKAKLKAAGMSYEFRIVDNSVIFSSTYSGRSERKSELQKISSVFPDFTMVVKSDGKFYLENKKGSKTYRILMKPSRVSSGILLKPQFFSGLVDQYIDLGSYHNILIHAINTNNKLSEDQQLLLISLVNAVKTNDYNKFKNIFSSLKNTISLNTINNDFGELLGPIAIVSKKLLPISASGSKVFFPARGNEPLLDYKIITASKVYKISAKSGDSTNTLKPGDVLSLIDAEPKLYTKYSNSLQYKVLNALKDNTWKQGPIEALSILKDNGFKEANWLESKTYTEKIRQESENTLVKISRESLDFTEMFHDATRLKVFYVKFKLDENGAAKWDILKDDKNRNEKIKKINFRSKNFVGRSNGDKLGFQPK